MAYRLLHLLVIVLACSYLISSNAIPMSRISSLLQEKGQILDSETMNQNQMSSEETMEEFIEARMDIEKNDYGPTTSNPVHTPKPPRV